MTATRRRRRIMRQGRLCHTHHLDLRGSDRLTLLLGTGASGRQGAVSKSVQVRKRSQTADFHG